ncbi:MAG: CoA transferase [Gammaproteobacteria bacterium]|nr:CoA transferase [Gammaproteobacteria bacterium]
MILEGIRVLDFTQYLAGPGVTRLMAELGAEIVKIEQAPGGDPSRLLPFVKDGRSGFFVQQNRGKQSVCIDYAHPDSRALILDLVRHCDVAIENFGPGVMQKRGLEYADLAARNPRLVMASVSAFGRDSPLAHKTGYDWIVQAYSGLMHMTGPRDGTPHPVGMSIADGISAVNAYGAVMTALFHRERSGRGQYLDLSMVDAIFQLHDVNVQGPSLAPGFTPSRMGAHHQLACPMGIFKAPEGYIVIMALDLQWKNVCAALGRPELEHDPRFVGQVNRAKHEDVLVPLIEEWLARFPTNAEALACLERHRVPAGPVLSPLDALEEEYFAARGTIRTTRDPILGELRIPGFPFRFSDQPELPDLVAPLLGEHNEAVLGRVLGYDAERLAALGAAGVLVKGER